MAIKILTGWSNPGGSTLCIMNLAKKLHDNGYEVYVYGPHRWHIEQLSEQGYGIGRTAAQLRIDARDTLIQHYVNIDPPVAVKKNIYWCHEMGSFMELNDDFAKKYDQIVFVSNTQKSTHPLSTNNVAVIPNFIDEFPKMTHERACGIIGSIDPNKNTHKSIHKALADGEEKIYLFGKVTDHQYYEWFVRPSVDSGKVFAPIYEEDKQKMYSKIDKVYHSAEVESFGLVKAECYALGIDYVGTVGEEETSYKSNNEVFETWKKILQ